MKQTQTMKWIWVAWIALVSCYNLSIFKFTPTMLASCYITSKSIEENLPYLLWSLRPPRKTLELHAYSSARIRAQTNKKATWNAKLKQTAQSVIAGRTAALGFWALLCSLAQHPFQTLLQIRLSVDTATRNPKMQRLRYPFSESK